MKRNFVQVKRPKSHKAAVNQAIYILDQLDIHSTRRRNIMKNQDLVNEKIRKLTVTLEEYSKQLEAIDTSAADWKETLEELKLDFNLTESEILEARSSLLREKISKLTQKADIQETGDSETI